MSQPNQNKKNNNDDEMKSMLWVEVTSVMSVNDETCRLVDHDQYASMQQQPVVANSVENGDIDGGASSTFAERDDANESDPGAPSRSASAATAPGATCQPARVAASGTAGCILGCLIGGPFLAAISGLGIAYASASDDGSTGKMARALGDVALATQAKVVEIDRKYDVATNAKNAAASAWSTAKELEAEHKVCAKTGRTLVAGGKAVVEFSKKHRVVERGAAGCTSCLQAVATSISATVEESKGTPAVAVVLAPDGGKIAREAVNSTD
mmetsp:Transcript_24753/g.69500  ORF Transcript_24753/g.69500 Transcript_24753/m.69500 type:complete len:268 (+) Transcript_24753:181-984(+)